MQQHASTYSVLTCTLDPWGWGVKGQSIFSECSHVAFQIRRERSIEYHASKYSVLTHTRDPCCGVKGPNILSESSPAAFQTKGNGA